MDLMPGHKHSDVGVIPDEWGAHQLGELLQSQRSIRYGIVQPGRFDTAGCYMLRSQDYSKGWLGTDGMHKVTPQLESQYRNARIRHNDLVMTVVGAGIGQVEVVPSWLDGAILSRSTARIAIDENKAARDYVRAFLDGPIGKRQILDCQKEGAQPVVSCLDLAKFFIAFPPLHEQRAIGTALSDVDALIAGLEKLIAKKRDLKQAVMQQLLTGQTRLPGFSGEWEVKQLGEFARLYQPQTISQDKFSDDGYPVFGANGVVGMYERFNHASPQITISCRGNCGTVNRTSGPTWITGNAMVVNLDAASNVDKGFVYYALTFSDLSVLVTGSGIPQIVRGPLSAFAIKLPKNVAEQTAIATVLSDMDADLSALEARLAKARAIKQGMMQELLTGRTRLV
jgi:type I restriction enzyme, S subunit